MFKFRNKVFPYIISDYWEADVFNRPTVIDQRY